jgi:SlyX protein
MSEERLTDLEIKWAFQDKALKELSSALYQQQRRIDALEKALKDVKDRVKAFSGPPGEDVLDEKPPHY